MNVWCIYIVKDDVYLELAGLKTWNFKTLINFQQLDHSLGHLVFSLVGNTVLSLLARKAPCFPWILQGEK